MPRDECMCHVFVVPEFSTVGSHDCHVVKPFKYYACIISEMLTQARDFASP